MLSVQKDEKRERRVKEPRRGLGRFSFHTHKESSIPVAPLAGPEMCCYLNLAICIALFIHHCAGVDNQSNPSPNRDGGSVAVRETHACLHLI